MVSINITSYYIGQKFQVVATEVDVDSLNTMLNGMVDNSTLTNDEARLIRKENVKKISGIFICEVTFSVKSRTNRQ